MLAASTQLWLPVRIRTRPVLGAVVAALLIGVGASVALAVVAETPPVHAAVIYWLSLSYSVSGLVAWWRKPASGIGPLMFLTGVCTLATTLSWSAAPVAQTVGQALDLLPMVLILQVFLGFPGAWPPRRLDRIVVVTGYLAAVVGQLVVMMLGGPGAPTLLTVVHDPATATIIHNVDLLLLSATALAGVALLAVRRRTDGRPLRRSLTLLAESFAIGLLMIAVLFIVGVFQGPAFPTIQRISVALLGLAPVTYLAGLLQAQLARTAVGDLVVELRGEPADLRAPLVRALRDPSLSLVYWLPQFASWTDQDGKPADLPTDPNRVTLIERDGEHVAALIHDPALKQEPELLQAVSAAAAIALQNGRLQAELRANLDELRGSRVRVIEAGQKERQRLERNLHDGAQQRLIALSLNLGILEHRLDADAETRSLLAQAREEIATSLAELRAVAQGLHPAVLSAHGLPVALESLAARAAVPVRLTVDVDGRLDEAVEVAAYYVVCESLANIGKHAQAGSASVEVARVDGHVVVEVVDDGIGGADTEGGTGLRGLADRVEALGGRLRIWTPRGGGTRVRAELPCG